MNILELTMLQYMKCLPWKGAVVYTIHTTIWKTWRQWKQERAMTQAASRRPLLEHCSWYYWCQVIDIISDATFNKNRLIASSVVRQVTHGHYGTINLHWHTRTLQSHKMKQTTYNMRLHFRNSNRLPARDRADGVLILKSLPLLNYTWPEELTVLLRS